MSKHKISKLDSGINVITDHMSGIESASINIMVKAGSRNEDLTTSGVAHFLEHMAFKGTKKRNAKQLAEEFDRIGGYFNAYTSREVTAYTAKLLKNDVATGMEILSDILQHSVFDQDELQRELGVILQEIAQTNDTPDDVIFDHFQSVAFPQQAIGRSILGSPEIISTFSGDHMRQFVHQHYHGSNMVISVAGNVQHTEVVRAVEELFTDLPAKEQTNLEPAEYQGGFQLYEKADLEQVQFVLGFKGMSYNDHDIYALHILTSIFGGGMSSRLFQEVREKRGLAYSVGAFNNSYVDDGVFAVYAGTSQAQVNELYQVVIEEAKKLTDSIQQDEIDRARTQLKASILMSQESSSYRAEELSRNYTIYGRHISHAEIIDKISSVDQPQLCSLMHKIITGSKPTVVAMGKLGGMDCYEQIIARI